MAKRGADLLVDVLSEAGVQRADGVSGHSLKGITDSIRTRSGMNWIHVPHEEAPAFAVVAEAHLTGKLAVCAGRCGPGNMHLIYELYDCKRSRRRRTDSERLKDPEYLGLELAFLTGAVWLMGPPGGDDSSTDRKFVSER